MNEGGRKINLNQTQNVENNCFLSNQTIKFADTKNAGFDFSIPVKIPASTKNSSVPKNVKVK